MTKRKHVIGLPDDNSVWLVLEAIRHYREVGISAMYEANSARSKRLAFADKLTALESTFRLHYYGVDTCTETIPDA